MKRTSDLADAIPHTPTSEHPPLACRQCQELTSRVTLSGNGGLCYPCYVANYRAKPTNYRAGKPESATVADMKTRLRSHGGAA